MGWWKTIKKVAGAVVGGIVAGPAGAVAGVIFEDEVEKGVSKIGEYTLQGGGSLVGLSLGAAGLVLAGPGVALTVYVIATVAGNLIIRQRHMTDQERAFAACVFGDSLPANDRIILTNLVGIGSRPFTLPNVVGQIIVNLGGGYDDPVGYSHNGKQPGQLFIHELTHAWQIAHSSFKPGFVCEGTWEQLQNTFGKDIYNPDGKGPNWNDFTNEQQAVIVDRWYAEGRSHKNRYFEYIKILTGGSAPPECSPSWDGWESLGGQITSSVGVASWSDNRLDTFARGTDGHLWHLWWGDQGWGQWEDLGGQIKNGPGVVSWSSNRIDIFAQGEDDQLWHLWWGDQGWSNWESLGGQITSSVGVTSWAENRLDIFARGTDGHVWHLWWGDQGWGQWEDLGGQIKDGPGAVSWGPNRIDVFARGTDDQLWHTWYDSNGHTW